MHGKCIGEDVTFAVKLTLMEIIAVASMACATAKSAIRRGFQDIHNQALAIEEKACVKLERVMWPATVYATVAVNRG